MRIPNERQGRHGIRHQDGTALLSPPSARVPRRASDLPVTRCENTNLHPLSHPLPGGKSSEITTCRIREAGHEPPDRAAVKQPSAQPRGADGRVNRCSPASIPTLRSNLLIHDPGRGVLRRKGPTSIFASRPCSRNATRIHDPGTIVRGSDARGARRTIPHHHATAQAAQRRFGGPPLRSGRALVAREGGAERSGAAASLRIV